MRGMKSTLALLVILIGVVAYIYFVDSNKPTGDTETKEKAFTDVKADEIEELQIKSADGQTTRLQKADGRWQLVEPIKADADQTETSNITSSLASVDITRVVDEKGANLQQYGLDPPRLDVGFRVKGKKDLQRILIGEKTPTGGDLYAQLPGKTRVFLVNSFLDSTFNKNTFALRDKKVLAFDRDKVDSLALLQGDKAMAFAKHGMDWRVTTPVQARGDYTAIEGALERIASVQMQGITAENGDDPRKYGLDRPSATITVGSGSSKATLLLGRTENSVVYAKDEARPMIFTVAQTLATDLFKDVSEYRRKDLFDARSFTTQQIDMTRGGETIALTQSKAADGKEIWKNAAGKTVDTMKVDDLLSKITALRADKIEPAANPALKTPALMVTIRFDDKMMETITLAHAGTTIVGSRADEPGTAVIDSTTVFDEVMKAIDAVK